MAGFPLAGARQARQGARLPAHHRGSLAAVASVARATTSTAQTRVYVRDALKRWGPRAILVRLAVEQDGPALTLAGVSAESTLRGSAVVDPLPPGLCHPEDITRLVTTMQRKNVMALTKMFRSSLTLT